MSTAIIDGPMIRFYKKYPDGEYELVGKCHASCDVYQDEYKVPVRNVRRILRKYPTDYLWVFDYRGKELTYVEDSRGEQFIFWHPQF